MGGARTGPEGATRVRSSEGGVKETGRVEAFSDGVFAIAITLLVLDLRLPAGITPEASEAAVWQGLLDLWPEYLAFLISFAFIGVMWINHHRLFTHIARIDTPLMLLNLLLLLGVTVLPFPTGVLSEHLGHPGGTPAALVYNGLFVAIAIFFNALWRYASSGHRLLDPDADPVAVDKITRQYVFGPIFYLVAFLAAFVSPELSLFISLLLALFFALPGPPLYKSLPGQ